MARTEMGKRSNIFKVLAVIFLILGIGGLCVVCGMYYATQLSLLEYGIVFDAGSSHTSMYLYRWESDKVNGTGRVEQMASCEVDDDGLTSYTDNPSEAGSSLTECLQQAAGNISWAIKEYTPVYLGATAGMRLLKIEDEETTDAILQSVQDELTNSGFLITDIDEQAKILSGQDEGIGLWITANYLSGTLGILMDPGAKIPLLPAGVSETLGALDLGGASTQVAFALTDNLTAPANETEKLTLFSDELTVYSDSYLCFGADEMRNQVLAMLAKRAGYEGNITHPCYVPGYESPTTYDEVFDSVCTDSYADETKKGSNMTVLGTGDNAACEDVMSDLFTESPYFDRAVTPIPDRLMARGSFAYTLTSLGLVNSSHKTVTYDKYVAKMNEWCTTDHSIITEKDIFEPENVCLIAHYIRHLISNVYKVPNDKWTGIVFGNEVSGVDLGWTLGYMTNITSGLPSVPKLELYNISTPVFIAVVIIACVLILLGVLAIVLACKFKRDQYESVYQP